MRGELQGSALSDDERDRGAGQIAQHRVRQTHLTGRGVPHGRHGGQTRTALLRRPGHRTGLRSEQQREPGRLHQAAEHRLVHPWPVRGQSAGIGERGHHAGLRRNVVPAESGGQGLRPARQRGGRQRGILRAGGPGRSGQHAVERDEQRRHQRHRRRGGQLGGLDAADVGEDRHHRSTPVGRIPRLHQPLCGGELHLRRLPGPDRPVFLPATPVR